MGFYNTIGEVYFAREGDFGKMVDELLEECCKDGTVIRLIFFGKPEDNAMYSRRLNIIREKVGEIFGDCMPAVSYVAQRPLVGELVLEVYKIDRDSETTVCYYTEGKINYLEIEDSEHKELVLGGVQGEGLEVSIKEQADMAFQRVGKILNLRKYEKEAIVRQWNYIERITAFEGEHQHYQDFNDSRTHFYAGTDWIHGYPAATGIGTQLGGILIDLNVIRPKTDTFRYVPLDNELQVAAHAYSQRVLLGQKDEVFNQKTTPKFERAKVVVGEKKGIVYISGTAAIRGEESLEGVGVLVQTGITMENINFLISKDNLNKHGVYPAGEPKIEMLRVYLKNPEDITAVKVYMEHIFTAVPISYLLADVCRDELLVEIEGIASFPVEEKAEKI